MSGSTLQQLAVPPALKPGDAISVVAPASSPKREAFDAAMAHLTSLGYRPKTYRDLCTPHGYLSGTDPVRADELNQAFADPETSMVLAVRGGYGCGRILDQIDFGLLLSRPKIVCGYSDLTALHAAIQHRCGMVSFHGPNLVGGLGSDRAEGADERTTTFEMLNGRPPGRLFQTGRTLSGGVATGRLVGGNLAVLMSLLGTPDEPDWHGAVLMLEDTGEAPYRIDRLLTQLRASGRLECVAGVVLGYFSDADPRGGPPAGTVLEEFLGSLGVPVVVDAPFGHEHPNLPMPLGARVRLDADTPGFDLLQAVVLQ